MSHSHHISLFFLSLHDVIISNNIRFDGISVEEAKSTTFIHVRILHLAKYLGQPFTTGSSATTILDSAIPRLNLIRWIPSHAETEIMHLESGEWESGPDYPFHSS